MSTLTHDDLNVPGLCEVERALAGKEVA